MRESRIEDYFVRQVELAGGDTRKVEWIGRRGAPDRLVLWPGRINWVELKKPLTPQAQDYQKREHDRLRAAGQVVLVLATIEQIDEYIEARRVEF